MSSDLQGKAETSSPASSSPAVQQQERKRPLGIVVLAGFAAFGGALSLYFIVNFPYPFAQWIFAMYAILDFGITLGYLAGWSWGLVLGYVGAIADIFPLALFFFGPLALLTNPAGWLVLLLAGIVVFTFFYLSTKNVKEWFKVEF